MFLRLPNMRFACSQYPRRSRLCGWLLLCSFVGYLIVLGLKQSAEQLRNVVAQRYPDEIQWFVDHWGHPDQPSASLAHWRTDAFKNVRSVSCHSHNDYWQTVPLYRAIRAGCVSIEADVWLFNGELYVGHDEASLTAERTLANLYIQPLFELLNEQNQGTMFSKETNHLRGLFDTDPLQTLVLLVDAKNAGAELYAALLQQLSALRKKDYLTYFNGTSIVERPLTIVGSGLIPFDLVVANKTYQDVFFDAPLDQIADLSREWPNPNRTPDDIADRPVHNSRIPGLRKPTDNSGVADSTHFTQQDDFTWKNSYYASTSFTRSLGPIKGSRLSQPQLQLLRGQIHGAHQRGLKARYWEVPHWPIGLRNHIWHILIREGADILSVDDLVGATMRDWRRRKGWWF